MIGLERLTIYPRVGVTDQERSAPREIWVDLRLKVDLSRAAASDDVSDTIDYGAVADLIEASIEGKQFRLLERLASHIIQVLRQLPVGSFWVRVSKPGVASSHAAYVELEG